ncbi:hypothetical protein Taro_042658 [Colocasia esculenta]|uniref:Uncharacterized protein n=1 Tax=Colocasia esculenta TaxID=4460 RepID=A0A843WZ14_COLES|nr:hypothetical protein [Colocasia esculenta]
MVLVGGELGLQEEAEVNGSVFGRVTVGNSLVYGPQTREEKHQLWEELIQFHSSSSRPWCVGGDVNVVATEAALVDFSVSQGAYTWSNMRADAICSRLDKYLVFIDWEDLFPQAQVLGLAKSTLDNKPILLKTLRENGRSIDFKFEQGWLRDPDFLESISSSSAMGTLVKKLKHTVYCLMGEEDRVARNSLKSQFDEVLVREEIYSRVETEESSLDHLFMSSSYSQRLWRDTARRTGPSITLWGDVAFLLWDWRRQRHLKADREYHQGHVKAEVLSPILSECERLTSSNWSKFYPLSAQQLSALNEAQAREGKPAISPATFLDMNSINLVADPFKVWEERYKVYVALHQALRANHNHYPVTMDQFLSYLHLKRMAPTIGPSYSVSFGAFKNLFEEQEVQAWETISHFASLFIQGVAPFGCEGRPGGIQGVVPFECEGRPTELGVVASLGGLSFGYKSSQRSLSLLLTTHSAIAASATRPTPSSHDDEPLAEGSRVIWGPVWKLLEAIWSRGSLAMALAKLVESGDLLLRRRHGSGELAQPAGAGTVEGAANAHVYRAVDAGAEEAADEARICCGWSCEVAREAARAQLEVDLMARAKLAI